MPEKKKIGRNEDRIPIVVGRGVFYLTDIELFEQLSTSPNIGIRLKYIGIIPIIILFQSFVFHSIIIPFLCFLHVIISFYSLYFYFSNIQYWERRHLHNYSHKWFNKFYDLLCLQFTFMFLHLICFILLLEYSVCILLIFLTIIQYHYILEFFQLFKSIM